MVEEDEQINEQYNGKEPPSEENFPEEICAERIYKGKVKYLIKWKNYRWKLWEPAEYFINDEVLLADWEKTKAERAATKANKKRTKTSLNHKFNITKYMHRLFC